MVCCQENIGAEANHFGWWAEKFRLMNREISFSVLNSLTPRLNDFIRPIKIHSYEKEQFYHRSRTEHDLSRCLRTGEN